MICKKCELSFGNVGSLRGHEKSCVLTKEIINSIITEYRLGSNFTEIYTKYGLRSKHILNRILNNAGIKRSFSEAVKLGRTKFKFFHSEETKQKIRDRRLKFMKENPEKTAWRQSNISYPEKIFLSKIIDIGWDKKYLIVRERSFFPYFIDFSFELNKIAVEIDGSQHSNLDRIESDKKKDDLLISNGWVVLRFSASKIQFEMDDCIEILRSFLNTGDPKFGVYSYHRYKKISKSEIFIKKRGRTKRPSSEKKSNRKLKLNIEYEPFQHSITKKTYQYSLSQRRVSRPDLNTLLEDIKIYGYRGTGRKYEVSDSCVRKWIKMYEKYGSEF
jgi:very-short-patch-repair endonuclease